MFTPFLEQNLYIVLLLFLNYMKTQNMINGEVLLLQTKTRQNKKFKICIRQMFTLQVSVFEKTDVMCILCVGVISLKST